MSFDDEGTMVLTCRRSFDHSRLIKRGESELESKRPTGAIRVNNSDNHIIVLWVLVKLIDLTKRHWLRFIHSTTEYDSASQTGCFV